MRYVVLLGFGLFLMGCGDGGWKDPDVHLEESGMYCYPTLGGVDCYRRPLKRNVRQPLGYEGPPPPQTVNE